MSNFYGQYIGFSGGGGAAALAGWYGTRYVLLAGYYPNRNTIDYITIASTGDAQDFGDTITAVRGSNSTGNGIGGRGLCVGGSTDSGQGNGGASYQPGLQYITFASESNATYFGNLLVGSYSPGGAGNDGIRGIKYGGEGGSPYYNPSIDYCTIATTGNAFDFGDMYGGGGSRTASANDGTTSVQAGISRAAPYGQDDNIQYITTQTLGDAVDWHGYTFPVTWAGGSASSSDSGRGVFHISDTTPPAGYNVTLEYITIQTPSDALDYGDLAAGYWATAGGMSSGTRGGIAGGYSASTNIDYFDFATTGSVADFGNLTVGRSMCNGVSGT